MPGKQAWVTWAADRTSVYERERTLLKAGSWVTIARDRLIQPCQVRSRAADIPSQITKIHISHACQGLCNLHSL